MSGKRNRIWTGSLTTLALLATVTSLLGLFAGSRAALTLCAAVLLVTFVRDRYYQGVLSRWIEDGGKGALPPAGGAWDDMFAQLYRRRKTRAAEIQDLMGSFEQMQRAAQALPDGVVILDAKDHIVWFNAKACTHLGLRQPDDIGRNITNLVRAPDFLARLESGQWDEPVLVRLRDSAAGGDRLLSLSLVAYGEGQKLLLSRDVTNIERLETMRRDFVSNVSHELKTPLTVLSGFLETIRELPLSAEQTSQYLELMTEQARRMENLVADLLTLSALEANGTRPDEPVNMQVLLEALLATCRQLSAGRHTITADIAPGIDLIGSASEISSALSNLCTNALRYTPEGGKITLRWEALALADGTGARFTVSDTGIGIAAADLPRLTERFYRVDRGRSRESGGTGLGLAIVKHALTRHDASLDIQSRLGEGSRFSANFPPRRMIIKP